MDKVIKSELETQLQNIKNLRKKRKFASSRLNKHLDSIFYLRFEYDASYREIAQWLRTHKRIKVNPTTIMRFVENQIQTIENNNG